MDPINIGRQVSEPLKENEDDRYVQEMRSRLLVKRQNGVIGEELLGNYYSQDGQDIDRVGKYRMELSINFWSTLVLAVGISKLVYPSSVRIVKKHFRLQGFLNIHMGIVPFVLLSNSVILGAYQGMWHIYWFNKQIEYHK